MSLRYCRDKRARELSQSVANTPGEGSTPDPQFGNPAESADGDNSSAVEPPLKRARSSSGAMDTLAAEEATGEREREACKDNYPVNWQVVVLSGT